MRTAITLLIRISTIAMSNTINNSNRIRLSPAPYYLIHETMQIKHIVLFDLLCSISTLECSFHIQEQFLLLERKCHLILAYHGQNYEMLSHMRIAYVIKLSPPCHCFTSALSASCHTLVIKLSWSCPCKEPFSWLCLKQKLLRNHPCIAVTSHLLLKCVDIHLACLNHMYCTLTRDVSISLRIRCVVMKKTTSEMRIRLSPLP